MLHPAPAGVDYSTNQSVFGKILRGEIPATVLAENADFLAFSDRTPRAPLHALVIPKQFHTDVTTLQPDDETMVRAMKDMALDLVRREISESAWHSDDYLLCFHIPPFTSVPHLHLHVLAPASAMSWWWRNGKYHSESLWCTNVDVVLRRLAANQTPVLRFPWSN